MIERELTTLHNELAALREQLARQGEQLAQQGAALAGRSAVRQRPARRRGRAVVLGGLLVLLLALAPLGVFAANFQDLNPGSGHNANINAIAAAGITVGCTDAQHYCPNDFVTREQMASFLARTAGLGNNPPVTNALTAVTATNATSAQDAATVQGRAPSDLLRVGIASNTDTIDLNLAAAQYTTLATVQLTAPTSGYVLVTGTTTIGATSTDCNGGNSGLACLVSIRLRQVGPGGGASNETSVVVNTNGNNQASASQTFVFQTAKGQHTYVLEAQTAYADKVEASSPTITALYVPFGPTGNTP